MLIKFALTFVEDDFIAGIVISTKVTVPAEAANQALVGFFLGEKFSRTIAVSRLISNHLTWPSL